MVLTYCVGLPLKRQTWVNKNINKNINNFFFCQMSSFKTNKKHESNTSKDYTFWGLRRLLVKKKSSWAVLYLPMANTSLKTGANNVSIFITFHFHNLCSCIQTRLLLIIHCCPTWTQKQFILQHLLCQANSQ